MPHRKCWGLGIGLGANLRIGESSHEPAQFMFDSIEVNDSILQIVFKTQRESIVILERTLANINELVIADSITVTEEIALGRRIAGRGDMDTLDVSDDAIELRERIRAQSDNAVVTDNIVVT